MRHPVREKLAVLMPGSETASVGRRLYDLEGRVPYRWGPDTHIPNQLSNPRYREAPLYLGPGVWDLNGAMNIVNDKVTIIGSGSKTIFRSNKLVDRSLMEVTGDDFFLALVKFEDGGNALTSFIGGGPGVRNLYIDSCVFEFTPGATGNSLYFVNCDQVTINNCAFIFGANGAALQDCDDALITNCRSAGINRASGYSVNLLSTGTGSAATRCNDCVVMTNHFSSMGGIRYNTSGAHLVGDSGAGQPTLNNLSIGFAAY